MELFIPSTLQSPWGAKQDTAGQKSVELSKTHVMASSETRHLEMDLVTAEGDKVTLSIDGRSQSLAAGYLETGGDTNGAYRREGFIMAAEQERSMTLTVEGDLNEQELRDIRKVLKTLKRMMNSFVNDRVKPMMAGAGGLKNLETVAGLSVEMTYSRQLLTARRTQVNTTYNQQGALDAAASTPVEASSLDPSPQRTQPRDSWAQAAAEADALTDAMADQMRTVRDFIDRMQGAVSGMFDDIRNQILDLDAKEPAGPALIDRMHQDLMTKVFSGDA